MKQKNLTILSLLTSLMLLIFAGSALADVTVEFIDNTFSVGRTDQTIEMKVTADSPINMFDVVAEVADGGSFATVTDVSFNLAAGSGGSDLSLVDGPTDDLFRFWGMNLGACDPILNAGETVAVTLTVDVDCREGIFTITPTGLTWDIDAYTSATTMFLADCAEEAVTGVMGTYEVVDNPPEFTNCPTEDLLFQCNEPANYDFEADDIDLGYCNEELTFSMVSGPGSINGTTGEWTWNSVGQVGAHNVSVKVTDTYGQEAQCDFVVVILNMEPEVTYCPPEYTADYDGISVVSVSFGETAEGQVQGWDPDDPTCPGPLDYFVSDGPDILGSALVIDSVVEVPDSGAIAFWSWDTDDEPEFTGIHPVTIGLTDQADTVYCDFEIQVLGLEVKISKVPEDIDGLDFVLQGEYVNVPITVFADGTTVGGFELLIQYDAAALTFTEASLGETLDNCGWEYFTFRKGPFGNCGGECPSGLVRLIGINDVNNGQDHPDPCASQWDYDSVTVANLTFYVTDDRTYECQYVPINFYWLDCTDNTISDASGYDLFLSRQVFWFSEPDDQFLLLDPADNPFIAGWQSIPGGIDCENQADPGKPGPESFIDFYAGGVDIACAEDIDDRGDLNLNGIAHEIADAVLYSNYFIFGPSVFDINAAGQVAASDVNNDGKVLTVGDLVYLIRVINGDEIAIPKLAPFANNVDVRVVNSINGVSVNTSSGTDIGAALFVFQADNVLGEPTLSASGMDIMSNYENGELRVLVYDYGSGYVPSGENKLFNVAVNGDIQLTHAEIVDYNGSDLNVNASMKALPTEFAAKPNYPNPFNPSTDIQLDLPESANWSIDIYNVSGQLVKSFSGHNDAGTVTVTWDATGMASGIYFYKATVGQYTKVHKMVLMK
ncbi:MAG: T9SS type A sorting domain-containing protein [candidate division Zixibacteria bacterium]|nr:T9SS type A sorting domain-containing protein [candidate division Zixibacteria bacterium]